MKHFWDALLTGLSAPRLHRGVRWWFHAAVVTVFAFAVCHLFTGCAHTAPPGGVEWVAPVPDYTPPPEPTKAPATEGSCVEAQPLADPCLGLLMPGSEIQYLYDVEGQAAPLRDLIGLCASGRAADRIYADQAYARMIAERDRARRKQLELFLAGTGVGAGVVAGILSAIFVASR
jgi:hypothetical protein